VSRRMCNMIHDPCRQMRSAAARGAAHGGTRPQDRTLKTSAALGTRKQRRAPLPALCTSSARTKG
jgi:hypothetical protein